MHTSWNIGCGGGGGGGGGGIGSGCGSVIGCSGGSGGSGGGSGILVVEKVWKVVEGGGACLPSAPYRPIT